jgi:hypothetical protein
MEADRVVLLSGVTAIAHGPFPTGIGGPAVLVAVSIGVTVPRGSGRGCGWPRFSAS